MSPASRCVTPEKVIHEKDTTGRTQLTIGHDEECVCVCVRVFLCVCVSAGPEAKLARAVFSHLTRPTSKCHKWAEIGMKPCHFMGQSEPGT